MRNYSIYEHEVLPLKCIKNGWNWLAFFFQGIWCLIKKLREMVDLNDFVRSPPQIDKCS